MTDNRNTIDMAFAGSETLFETLDFTIVRDTTTIYFENGTEEDKFELILFERNPRYPSFDDGEPAWLPIERPDPSDVPLPVWKAWARFSRRLGS